MGLVDDLLPSLDAVLGIRDTLGVGLKEVSILTRTWDGDVIGEGDPSDEADQMLPTPKIAVLRGADKGTELHAENGIRSGGGTRQGDLQLKYISKNSYPDLDDVDCSSSSANIEKFYFLGTELYQVIGVKEELLTWTVMLRRCTDQTTYLE
jgi:hypothetical protein